MNGKVNNIKKPYKKEKKRFWCNIDKGKSQNKDAEWLRELKSIKQDHIQPTTEKVA